MRFVSQKNDKNLIKLIARNQLFRSQLTNPSLLSEEVRRKHAMLGQHPYAVVIACSDSRVPVEHIFTAGIGDLFVIRTAGNAVGDLEIGSVLYAIDELQIPLVFVMGHTNCGAVKAAIENKDSSNPVIAQMLPALQHSHDPRTCEKANVRNTVGRLRGNQLIAAKERRGEIRIYGGLYDIETGVVHLLQ